MMLSELGYFNIRLATKKYEWIPIKCKIELLLIHTTLHSTNSTNKEKYCSLYKHSARQEY